MAWASQFTSSRDALLGPLVGLLNGIATGVLLGVLALGVLYARLFGTAVSKDSRDPELESNDSDALPRSRSKNVDTGAPTLIDDGAKTPVQARNFGSGGYWSEDDYATNVRPTPPGQMLLSGMGPTPATPAPAHPAAQTVPARRTSAPPSPTNILPRNLESVLLAAANGQATADDVPCCAGSYTTTDTTAVDVDRAAIEGDAQALLSSVDTSVAAAVPATVPTLPVSTTPPPPLDSAVCPHSDELTPVTATPSSPPEALNGKADPDLHTDAVPTVARRVPSVTAATPAARVLTAPFESVAARVDSSDSPAPTSAAPLATLVATVPASGNDLPALAAAAALAAETPTSSRTSRHPINGPLFREVNGGTIAACAAGPDGFAATAPGAAALAGLVCVDGSIAAAHLDKQQPKPATTAAARAPRTGLVVVPAVQLPATPRSPGPEGASLAEASDATPAHERPLLRKGAGPDSGAGAGEVTGGAAEIASPQAVAETPIAFAHKQPQRQPSARSPAGTPVASPALSKRTAAAGAAGILHPTTNGTPQAKARGTPGPKQQQTRAVGTVASSNGTSTATPRAVVSSPKQKRGVVSPTAAGAAATPATARRPVGPGEVSVRSPRPAADKNPVARMLNPILSPKSDVTSETAAAAAANHEDGSALPSLRSVRSETLAAAGSIGSLPRYAAPTAASKARKAQLPLTPPRASTQKALLVSGVSVGGTEAGGVGEVGGGGITAGGTPRRNGQEGKLRATVSGGVLGL